LKDLVIKKMLELDNGQRGYTGIGFKILGNHYSNLYFIYNELNEGLYDYLENGVNMYFYERDEILKLIHPFNNKKALGILVTIKHNYEDNALLLSNKFKLEFEEFYEILLRKFNGIKIPFQ
jgi:hypothetical protein